LLDASSPAFAAPLAHASGAGAGSLLRVLIALVLVLAAVLATAWLARRARALGGGRSGELELLAQLPLGPRERAVLVRVGSCELLLGVASGQVRTLHVLSNPAPTSGALAVSVPPPQHGSEVALQPPSFKALLRRSLGL
jgi:flagellar protein FliO/FliZ